MAVERVCARPGCGNEFAGRPITKRYCSKTCRAAAHRTPMEGVAAPTKHRGMRSELLAAVALVDEGYEIYRAMSQHSSCDLVAVRGEEVLRVEVRTASGRSLNGEHQFNRRVAEGVDALVSVCGDEVKIERI